MKEETKIVFYKILLVICLVFLILYIPTGYKKLEDNAEQNRIYWESRRCEQYPFNVHIFSECESRRFSVYNSQRVCTKCGLEQVK